LRARFGVVGLFLASGLLAPPAGAQTPAGGEFRINQHTPNAQRPMSVASAADGGFVVVWASQLQDGPSGGDGTFARRYDAAGNAGPEFQVNQFTTSTQSYGAVAVTPDGGFVVAWHSFNQDGSDLGIFARRYDALGTALDAEFQVNSYVSGEQARPSVGAAANGSFVVVWDSWNQDGHGFGIFGQRHDALGNRMGSEFMVNLVTTSFQLRPRVAVAEDGRFVVVWDSENQDGAGLGVFFRRYDAAGNPGSELQVNTFTTGHQRSPAVGMARDGRFVLVWESDGQDGHLTGVFGQRYDASGLPQSAEFRVNTYTTGNQARPYVAMAADGSFVVNWHSASPQTGAEVRGRLFDPQGVPIGDEFAVNTYTTGDQTDPFVSSAPNGAFVVVWRSAPQDGSSSGGFGQRYGASDLIFSDGFEP
jgi:hypothetical protein